MLLAYRLLIEDTEAWEKFQNFPPLQLRCYAFNPNYRRSFKSHGTWPLEGAGSKPQSSSAGSSVDLRESWDESLHLDAVLPFASYRVVLEVHDRKLRQTRKLGDPIPLCNFVVSELQEESRPTRSDGTDERRVDMAVCEQQVLATSYISRYSPKGPSAPAARARPPQPPARCPTGPAWTACSGGAASRRWP